MSTPNFTKVSGSVTIANGASLSGSSGTLEGANRISAIITDAAWDTNAVSFQGSADGTNFFSLYKEGTEYSLAGVVASAMCTVDMSVFVGCRAVKVRSGTAGAAVNQTGDTVVTLVTSTI